MIPNILLPRYFKWIGIILFLAGFTYAVICNPEPDDVNHPSGLFVQLSILAGLLLIAGARERMEDEMIKQIRLTSLQWSVFIFIALRLVYKCIAFYTKDVSWLPQWQVNSLLLFYIVLFYYQLYVKDILLKIGKKDRK